MIQDKSKTLSTKLAMKVQEWLSLGETYATPRLKGGSRTSVSRDKVIESLRTPHLAIQVSQVMYGAKGVKHWISSIRRGDKK